MLPENMFGNKNLLVLCQSYKSFQKDPTEIIATQFSRVNALVRTNPIAELGLILPIPALKGFSSAFKIDKNRIPKNVHVFATPVRYIPTDRGYKKLGDKHLVSVEALIQKQRIVYDLIHSHFTWSSGYVGAKLKERDNIPLVITAHGYDVYSLPFKDAIWKRKIEYTLNSADAIITVSQSNLECIRRLSVDTPVHVIPNGFREDLFVPREKTETRTLLGLPQDRTILLTIGNLDSVKGHRYLVEAIEKLLKEKDDILCVIVGVGREQRSLEKQIRSADLGNNILMVGGKPHHEIPLWINACDLFVLPSLNEGNPTVMFEALGCGKPFVGTRVGGVPEIIISEDYGLLVEPGNAAHLAEKILIALEKEWDQKKILARAEHYTWKNIAREIVGVYSQVSEIR